MTGKGPRFERETVITFTVNSAAWPYCQRFLRFAAYGSTLGGPKGAGPDYL